jgi:ABC-type bacteriocin/lantibiotic exporter with double-glycine peptidase domain
MLDGVNNEPIALVLGIYAVAIFRLLPSINRMLTGAQQVRFCFPSVSVIAEELDSLGEANKPPQKYGKTATRMPKINNGIGVENLSFKHVGSNKYVLQGVNLHINVGELVGIVGESGAGKSTLVDLMLGLLDPTEGSIKIDGVDIVGNVRDWQQQVGYVPQHIYLTDDSVRKNIAFGISEENINDAEVSRAVNAAQLDGLVHEMPSKLETVIGEHGMRLSGGQRQRIGIARALYHNPNVLILDESTSALDQETEAEIMSTIESLHGQKTIIIVTHRVKTLSDCDTIYSFTDGKLVGSGSYQELIESKKV